MLSLFSTGQLGVLAPAELMLCTLRPFMKAESCPTAAMYPGIPQYRQNGSARPAYVDAMH